jgi:hypothetical protein
VLTQDNSAFSPDPQRNIRLKDSVIDIILVVVVTGLAFLACYHPYFFGDELNAYRNGIPQNYDLLDIYVAELKYKPRIIYNAIVSVLVYCQAARIAWALFTAGFMVWINILLYFVVRYRLSAGRAMAWLTIATVLSSRYGMMFYFDYSAGLIELSATAFLLTGLLSAWRLSVAADFKWQYGAMALLWAVLCIFTHERYALGFLGAGFFVAILASQSTGTKRRIDVVCLAVALGFVPVLLFWVANIVFGRHSLLMGTSGTTVLLEWGTLWRMVTYAGNVFLNWNYGPEWLWGHYNHLHPVGKIIGWSTVACIVLIIALAAYYHGVAWNNIGLGAGLLAVALPLIVVASLPDRQESRWMFPVGVIMTLMWVIMLKKPWRYILAAMVLGTNLTYLALGSHDNMSQIYSSRSANSLAGSLNSVVPMGRRGMVLGPGDGNWTIQGGGVFSRVNLRPPLQIRYFGPGRTPAPTATPYDFALVFLGFGPHRIDRYALVAVDTAMAIAGVLDPEKLPTKKEMIGSSYTWRDWNWNVKPDQLNGSIILRPGVAGTRAVSAANLDQRLLVYRCRAIAGGSMPMRLQVNWHAQQGNRFLGCTIVVVHPKATWHWFATLLDAPPGADIGYVYATLHDAPRGLSGAVELKSIELK